MSELDDAIREHLELKRRHGARDAEVKQLEDEAFGTGERPADPFSAADQLLRSGEEGEQASSGAPPAAAEQGTPTDVPPPEMPLRAAFDPDSDPGAASVEAPPALEDPVASPEVSPIPPPPPRAERDSEVVRMPTEEHPAPDPPSEEIDAGQPAAQSFDEPESVPEDLAAEAGGGPGLYDFEAEAPVEDDFSESAESVESGAGDEDAFADLGPADSAPAPAEPADFDDFEDFEEADPDPGPGAVTADTDEREAVEPPEPEPGSEHDADAADEQTAAPTDDEAEDLLEETPDFLEDGEDEDEDLWFEKRPPKDFDFDE